MSGNDGLMFAFLEFPLGDLGKRVYHPLQDVLLLVIAIVVVEDFQDLVRVLRDPIEHIQDQVLVMVNGVARIQDPQEDLLEEDDNLLLEVLSEVLEDAIEDRERQAEDGLLIGHALLQKKLAKGLLDDIDELL